MTKTQHKTESTVQHKLNYTNDFPLVDLLDLFQSITGEVDENGVEYGTYFHTVDGAFWRFWRLQPFAEDTMNAYQKEAVAELFARVINQYPVNTSGQLLRIVHHDVRAALGRYANSQGGYGPSTLPFADEIRESIAHRQYDGAVNGFFKHVTKTEATGDPASESVIEDVTESVRETLRQGSYARRTELVLAIRYAPEWHAEHKSLWRDVLETLRAGLNPKGVRRDIRQRYLAEVKNFSRSAESVEQALVDGGFSPRRVTGQGMVELLFRELNPAKALDWDRPVFNATESVREQVVNGVDARSHNPEIAKNSLRSPVEPTDRGWTIGDHHYQAVSLASMPGQRRAGMVDEILQVLNTEHWAVVNFHALPAMKLRALVQVRMNLQKSKRELVRWFPFINLDEEEMAARFADLAHVQNAVNPEAAHSEKPFAFSFHVVVKGRDEEIVRRICSDLEQSMWEKGFHETDRGDAIIHHCLPGNFRRSAQLQLARSQTALTRDLARFYPILGNFAGCQGNACLFNSRNGEPVFVDPFERSNAVAAHSLILGGTGSGKSFLANSLFQQIASREQTKTFIVDKGESYKEYCRAVSGQHIDLGLDSSDEQGVPCLNPFYVPPDPDGNPQAPRNDELDFMVGVVTAMCLTGKRSGVTTVIRKPQQNRIREGLRTLFAQRHGREEVTLTGLMNHLEEAYGEEGAAITALFKEFTRASGTYGELFDGYLDVDWENPVVVIETDRLSNSPAMPVTIMVLFHQINTYCKYSLPRNMRKIFALDEAWAALADPAIASLLAEAVLTLRKYNTGLFLITQSMDHVASIVTAEGGQGGTGGLLENIKHFFFMGCSPRDYSLAEEYLHFTEEEIAAWSSVSGTRPYFSEFFYRFIDPNDNQRSGILRYYSAPVPLWLSTTDPGDTAMRGETLAQAVQGLDPDDPEYTRRRRTALRQLAMEYPYGSAYRVDAA